MGKEIIKQRKVSVRFNREFVSPEYNITMENIDGTKNWTITGKINGMSNDMAESVDIIAKNVETIVQNTKEEKVNHTGKKIKISKLVGLAALGSLVALALLSSLRFIKKSDSNVIPDEEIVKEFTIYAVSVDTDIFESMYSLDDWEKVSNINIATLRGVNNLHDKEYEKYGQDIDAINYNVDRLKNRADIDLNEFLSQCQEVNNYSLIAMEDIENIKNIDEEKDNYDILNENYRIVSNINRVSGYFIYDIEKASQIKNDYSSTKVYEIGSNSVYGIHDSSIKFFTTLEEAQLYYDSIWRDFENHITNEYYTDDYTYLDGYYDNYHKYMYDATLTKYETTDPNETKESILKGREPKNTDETEIDHMYKSNYGS